MKIDGSNLGSALAGSIAATRLSANTTSGFSIIAYDGNNTSGATVGHGLSETPELIIIKNLEASVDWIVYSEPVGPTKGLQLNGTGDAYDYAAYFNDTAPTASVFSLGDYSGVNAVEDMIAYAFHSVEGYSKVGSYTGNGNADGTFVYTGFIPAYLMIKRTDSAKSWFIHDDKRSTYNVIDGETVKADTNGAEVSDTGMAADFDSNGFKLRTADDGYNDGTYLYLAFAKSPFKYANAR